MIKVRGKIVMQRTNLEPQQLNDVIAKQERLITQLIQVIAQHDNQIKQLTRQITETIAQKDQQIAQLTLQNQQLTLQNQQIDQKKQPSTWNNNNSFFPASNVNPTEMAKDSKDILIEKLSEELYSKEQLNKDRLLFAHHVNEGNYDNALIMLLSHEMMVKAKPHMDLILNKIMPLFEKDSKSDYYWDVLLLIMSNPALIDRIDASQKGKPQPFHVIINKAREVIFHGLTLQEATPEKFSPFGLEWLKNVLDRRTHQDQALAEERISRSPIRP